MERWNDRGAAIIPFGNNIILMRRERGYGKNRWNYYKGNERRMRNRSRNCRTYV